MLSVAFTSFTVAVLSGLAFGPFIGALVIEGAASIAFMLQHFLATLALPFYAKRNKFLRITTHVIIPSIALIMIAFAVLSTVYPVPAYPLNLLAYAVTTWGILGAFLISLKSNKK